MHAARRPRPPRQLRAVAVRGAVVDDQHVEVRAFARGSRSRPSRSCAPRCRRARSRACVRDPAPRRRSGGRRTMFMTSGYWSGSTCSRTRSRPRAERTSRVKPGGSNSCSMCAVEVVCGSGCRFAYAIASSADRKPISGRRYADTRARRDRRDARREDPPHGPDRRASRPARLPLHVLSIAPNSEIAAVVAGARASDPSRCRAGRRASPGAAPGSRSARSPRGSRPCRPADRPPGSLPTRSRPSRSSTRGRSRCGSSGTAGPAPRSSSAWRRAAAAKSSRSGESSPRA